VNISLVTTKELVIKDFQYEPDEKKFIMASTNFIKSLAGALASVTCKEPLRMSFTKKMKDFLVEKKN
jgi:CCR4-NOT transcription complex subunit 1